MIGFEGRLQWRQQTSFKLRANLIKCKKYIFYKTLDVRAASGGNHRPLPKFAIRLFFVRRTIYEQAH
jgi:hypothetical protein